MAKTKVVPGELTVRPLTPETWAAFADLAERHNGVFFIDKQITASFLYNGTRSLFEQAGFAYSRPKGKNHCVMSTTVSPA